MKLIDRVAYWIFYQRWNSILQNNPQLGKWMAHYILAWYELNEKKVKSPESPSSGCKEEVVDKEGNWKYI